MLRLVEGCVDGLAAGCVDGCVEGRAAGCVEGCVDGRVAGCVVGRVVALLFLEPLLMLPLLILPVLMLFTLFERSTLTLMLLFTLRTGALMFVGAR